MITGSEKTTTVSKIMSVDDKDSKDFKDSVDLVVVSKCDIHPLVANLVAPVHLLLLGDEFLYKPGPSHCFVVTVLDQGPVDVTGPGHFVQQDGIGLSGVRLHRHSNQTVRQLLLVERGVDQEIAVK